jgi:cell division protein FtsZ
MGDEVRVTVIAAGFDRWEEGRTRPRTHELEESDRSSSVTDLFGGGDDDSGDGDDGDDFDVPSFLR